MHNYVDLTQHAKVQWCSMLPACLFNPLKATVHLKQIRVLAW